MARGRAKRAGLHEIDKSWMKWRTCELCGSSYAANNYSDRKTRVKRWHGVEICARCRFVVIPAINRAMELKVVKLRKRHTK